MNSQLVNHQANQDFKESINSLVQQITEVTKENTQIQKSLVSKEQEFWTQLLKLEHKYQKESLTIEREHDQEIQALKNKQAKEGLISRILIYPLLFVIISIVF